MYYFFIWVGNQAGQEDILGMDLMVPAGNHLDLAHGIICFSDELRISYVGRIPPYRLITWAVNLKHRHVNLPAGKSTEDRI